MAKAFTVLNICILPPPAVARAVVDLANNLDRTGLQFRVDGRDRHPHLTVLQRRTRTHFTNRYLERFSDISFPHLPEFTAYGLTASANGYIEIGYNRSEALEKLQHTIYEAFEDLEFIEPGARSSSLTAQEAKNEENYGYKLFDDLYRPHISLGSYRRDRREVALPNIVDLRIFNFSGFELAIAHSDEYGAVVKILKRISIPDSVG